MSTEKKTAGFISFESLNEKDPFELKKAKTEEDNSAAQAAASTQQATATSSLTNENITAQQIADLTDPNGVTKIDREKQTPPEKQVSAETLQYRRQLKKLLGENQTVVQEVNGEEVEIPIDELESIDEDLYTAIISSFMEREKEEASKNKISTEGLSDFDKTYLEIAKKGGDTSKLIEVRNAYVNPLDKLDMDTPSGQKKAIELDMLSKGRTMEEVEAQILFYENRGILESKGLEAESNVRKGIADFVEQQKQYVTQREEKAKEDFKNYKKNLKENLTKSFELKEAAINKLVDFATKAGEDKKFAMDQALKEARLDPVRSAKLALWLFDENEYDAQISNKKLNEKAISTAIKLGTVAATKTAASGGQSEPVIEKTKNNTFIPLE